MGTGRSVVAALAAALVAVTPLTACSVTPTADRQAAGFDEESGKDVWSLTVGQRAVVAFPEDDYAGWIMWSQAIAEDDVAILVNCPSDTSGFAYDAPRGGACVEAVGPGTATLVWTDPDGVDAYVSTIVVAR
jgi:hypothetical protein